MERHHRTVVTTVVLAMLAVAAARPVALRVETTPVRPAGDGTVVSVTIQVAPEDRPRLGRDIWVQGELHGGGLRIDRLTRALDLDERGQATFEAAWPPGDYELRVEVSGGKPRVGGVWVGPLKVPSLAPVAPASAPTPGPATATVETPAEAAPASPIAVPAPPQPPEAGEAPVEPAPETGTPPSPVEPPSAEAPSAAVPEITTAAAPVAAAEPAPVEAAPAPARPDASPAPPQPEIAEPPAGPAPSAAAQPSPVEAPPAEGPPVAAPQTPGAAPVTASSAWDERGDGLADVTAVVTERNRPILGLGPSAFRLRVGGSEVAVEESGDGDSAPLNLAIVVDLSPEAGDLAHDVARQLGAFSLRAGDGGRLMVVTTADPRPAWGATPDSIARWAEGAGEGRTDDLAELVSEAARAIAGSRGRSFLVVVSDGSDSSDKAAWRATVEAAEAAGVPVFVIGLRDSGFDDRARAGLGRIADATGGHSYFLGSAEMAGMTLDYVGELIDASYALAFRLPPGAGPGPHDLKLEVVNREWDVRHSRLVP